ncbi:Lpg0189 family type II secretion system effector [Legionella spiritensis]|uniref:Uncharacterized protein n=1 Tax=Legionella spiritensis TaxID=452 RepID=A0A0W0YXJ3_LEGSP|nr:Lpg0189 family type II secretion system effector [Legionella spiritensis]KTD61613.1 hypothetical protein Lspi_2243 [Legionella spiritensis]SNV39390.1 Uncharacterised protein [Legionella spiritensis]
MKISIIAASLMAASLSGHAESLQTSFDIRMTAPSAGKHTVVKKYSNLKEVMSNHQSLIRNGNYPTQIVRIRGEFAHPSRYCDEVLGDIDEFFNRKITSDQFLYNTLVFCGFDPATEYATQFAINSYFDPLNDKAVAYLQTYLAEHNGRELLGTTFQVEEAKGVAVSMDIDAGEEADRSSQVLTRYRHDNQTHYFSSNYDLTKQLITDIRQRFYSNDPDKILPFLQKWFFHNAGSMYYYVLKSSNFVELRPQRLFIMDKEPKVYTSPLRMYFAHHCDNYENSRCL